MSGNPDVLEYYRNKHSSKPIRVIDLSECAVWKHAGPGFVRKEFQNNFVFIVKTTSRTFYLVAKTEEEMQVWVHSISQVCNLGHLEDGAGESSRGSYVLTGYPGMLHMHCRASLGKPFKVPSPRPLRVFWQASLYQNRSHPPNTVPEISPFHLVLDFRSKCTTHTEHYRQLQWLGSRSVPWLS